MAVLSQMTSGVILKENHFGTHLNDQGKTIDLEKTNFQHAAENLSEIWSSLVIDGHPVDCSYVQPPADGKRDFNLGQMDQVWYFHNVRTSQYLTQIVKCNSKDCCGEHRSDLTTVLKSRFS